MCGKSIEKVAQHQVLIDRAQREVTGSTMVKFDDVITRQTFFSFAEFDCEFHESDPNLWNEVLESVEYVPPPYTLASINYSVEYYSSTHDKVVDLSCMLKVRSKVIGVWPLLMSCKDGRWHLHSWRGVCYPPLLLSGLKPREKKNILSQILTWLDGVAAKSGMESLVFADPFLGLGPPQPGVMGQALLNRGAIPIPKFFSFVDLRRSEEEYRRSLRKSYKSLINKGERLWGLEVMTSENFDEQTWENFRQLHIRVAGREVRDKASWDQQAQNLRSDHAFLITLFDMDKELVGAGFFEITQDEGYYSVGCYDRNLFDKPVGHVVQMAAIRHMIGLGLKWYRIGLLVLPFDECQYSKKEANISSFKSGFATNVITELEYDWSQTLGKTAS